MMPENKELPPPIPGGDTTAFLKKSGSKGILCGKCNHVNRPGATKCSVCESHLHIKCNDCGARNERFQTRCQECGRRMHKSFLERISARSFKGAAKITPLQIVLLLVFVGVAFYCVLIMQRVKLPVP